MLRRIKPVGTRRGDEGMATSILVMATALVLMAGFLLLGRIAQAGDLRSRAQVGADAAALGTIAPLRDRAVDLALQGIDPAGAGYWLVDDPPEVAAKDYAKKNDTTLVGKVHLTSLTGGTAKVDVATEDCQLKRDEELTDQDREDLRHRRNLCTDNAGKTGIGRHGRATAVAKLLPPECRMEFPPPPQPGGNNPMPSRLLCDGVQAWPNGNRATITRLFRIRLVDREDPVGYTGLPDGLVGGGPAVATECATEGKKPADDLAFGPAVVAWALCWEKTPYTWGGGNISGPTKGFCCSPGGHDGSVRVGFDCSGLTLYAVYQASKGRIQLGHYTGNQISDPRGRPVPLNALQQGDLLFWEGHVAIYFGPGKMVEAPRTGSWVMISDLRTNGLIGARRFG